MLKFRNDKLKQEFIYSINKLIECDCQYLYVNLVDLDIDFNEECAKNLDLIKCVDEEYSVEELELLTFIENSDNNIIDKQDIIGLTLDDSDSLIEFTINEFIYSVKQAECSSINDDGICITKGKAILRVSEIRLDCSQYHQIPFFETSVNYKGIDIHIKTSDCNDLYSLVTYFNYDFGECYPVKLPDDLFVEITYDVNSKITIAEVTEVFNAYIFQLFLKTGFKLELSPRDYFCWEDEDDYEDEDEIDTTLNPKLFSKGMSELISMYNQAEGHNDDRSIVEYVKIIEFISVTVIRQKETIEVKAKLKEFKSSNPDADYIRELGNIFTNYNKKLTKDNEMIRIAIRTCCVDIESLSRYSPMFIPGLKELSKKIKLNPTNKGKLIDGAYNNLAKSISDTRNNLSHAKANYDKKGLECPDNEKEQFVILLRKLCEQVIKWFYNTEEFIRIVKEK